MTSKDERASRIGGFYGRRVGRGLRGGQRSLLDTKLPAMGLPIEEAASACLDPATLFGDDVKSVGLEIGFGSGEHLLALLEAEPQLAMIGCEPFTNGMASLLRRVDGTEPEKRLRLHGDDAGSVIQALCDNSLSRVYLLFPDPWPKRRHARRRFLQTDTLDEIARLLVDGGRLYLASDHPVMVDWMLARTRPHPDFEWLVTGVSDWRCRPGGWAATRYEAKRLHGEPCYFTFRRKHRAQTA